MAKIAIGGIDEMTAMRQPEGHGRYTFDAKPQPPTFVTQTLALLR
jgi:hypothetical protein